MNWLIFVLAIVIAFLLVICYALLVVASDADERADEMYRAWKESKDEDRR